ncbi:UDP-N-acetylmuramate dehydrogenase [uncultured Umboniibacter sp.]|uniref:UDP-N-acetylmuramate dehydrogenase n=1 Tax=uncultured Umboniibacter sp. TaxID=1798917 RepID=UPI002611759D|nr:UDP-N-acetylmuramate dehydrogenase [uncultured Umboniibacter sp.]
MIEIESNVNLKQLNTMALASIAEYYCAVHSVAELTEAIDFAQREALALHILGEGSNTLPVSHVSGLSCRVALKGIEIVQDSQDTVILRVASGENWHQLVAHTVNNRWWGIENLALIPGAVGAAPVQNIGAYGVEIADVLLAVEVFDLQTLTQRTLSKAECELSYRESTFKGNDRGRFVILQVLLELSKIAKPVLSYAGLSELAVLADREALSASRVAERVIELRSAKLPNPTELPNSGSYFKNPIVARSVADSLLENFPQAPHWVVGQEVKFAAAWLMDQCGFRGTELAGGFQPYHLQALVMTNPKGGSYRDLLRAETEVIRTVASRFGITLEREPQLLG